MPRQHRGRGAGAGSPQGYSGHGGSTRGYSNGYGHGPSRNSQGMGRGQEEGRGNYNGYAGTNNVAHKAREQPVIPPLTNFFNFTTEPLPIIATPPERSSAKSPRTRAYNETDQLKESDDNKNYVQHYLQLANQQAEKLASVRLQQQYEQEEGFGDRSIIGTIPTRENNDDPEVFWKYDMKKRPVDTSNLMINKSRDRLLSVLHSRQVVIVEGFTGCGKTTQVPQFILDDAAENKKRCKIVVTQPRRIAAISVATRVCQERGWKVGSLVGYQVGMNRTVTDDTRLIYMTTGVLLQLLISKRNLTEYTHIIIDEVHERDLETDLLLLVIKKLMIDHLDSNTKVLLMSATLNADKFINYFPSWGKTELSCTAIIKVTQPSLYPISERYLDTLTHDYGFDGFTIEGSEEAKLFQECYEIATKIIEGFDFFEYSDEKFAAEASSEMLEEYYQSDYYKKGKDMSNRGAVLVFLPGLMEIDTMYKMLQEYSTTKAGNCDKRDVVKWTILPLHSSITSDEQQKVFYPATGGYRKIILATNIAESSITVPDIKYVIDFCLTKSLSCDPTTNYTTLRLEWASKNQCIQRRGRCGRVSPGHVFRMIPRHFYDEYLLQDALPEMEKASLEAVVLNVKVLEMGSPLQILALAVDPPKKSGIGRAVANLKEVGALTLNVGNKYSKYDGDLTHMGKVMSRLPIDIRFGRLIMLGMAYGVLDDAVIIAAGLSTKSPFSFPFTKRLDAYTSKLGWSNRTYSDCFALLNAFSTWTDRHRANDFRNYGEEKSWARSYFLQLSVLREIGVLVDEIKRRLNNVGIFVEPVDLSAMERGLILKIVIAGSFYPNYFLRSRPNKKDFEKEIFREVSGFNPLNSVAFHGFPIEQPGKLYAKHIADALTHVNSIPQIHFHASKVIVSFDPRGEKIGYISHGVYRAIKMRHLRHKITFLTLGRHDSMNALSTADEYLKEQRILKAPALISLPSIKEEEIDCEVSWIESPTEFWIIRKDRDGKKQRLEAIFQELPTGLTPLSPREKAVGALCICVRKQEKFRARIDCLRQEDALVYFIDKGISVWRSHRDLFAITPFMIKQGLDKIEALAIQCRLSQLKPATANAGCWYEEACKNFGDFVDESQERFIMKVFSVVDSIVAGVLFSPLLQQSGNDRMFANDFADKMEESRESMENNTARKLWKPLNYELSEIAAHDERQYSEWGPQRLVVPPRLTEETGTPVTLRGPSTPLEMTFASLCRSAHLKQVQIEGCSANCVALDQEPLNPCSRMLIAASVSIAHRTGNIVARETTMMPAIPGLVSLMTMIFCPKLELRVDDLCSRYTGCISGLGVDPIEHDPVYPDHDMEIIFDVAIDNDDIKMVNSIRTTMNMLMQENIGHHRGAERMREKVRRELIKLMQRERDTIDEVWPDSTHEWNVIPESQKYQPSDTSQSQDNDVFPLHTCINLNPLADPMGPITPRNVFQAPIDF